MIHPDSLKKDAPTHYYCSKCGAKHWRGSIRYQDHFAHRSPAVNRQDSAKASGESTMNTFNLTPDIVRRVAHWLLSGDTGISSKTIAAIALGATPDKVFGFDIPYDCSDFGRCYRLLKAIPELRDALPIVAETHQKWRPLVEVWDELTALYEQDLADEPQYEIRSYGRGRPKQRVMINKRGCYDRLKSLYDACMEADGFIKTGHGSWTRIPTPAAASHQAH